MVPSLTQQMADIRVEEMRQHSDVVIDQPTLHNPRFAAWCGRALIRLGTRLACPTQTLATSR
jgi:hypothetical protein